MVFNVLAHNRDDHSRNFAFLFQDGSWRLSPAFDLTMSEGMSGQHTSDINGSGDPTRRDVMAVAERLAITDASAVIDEVSEATGQWQRLADEFGVSRSQADSIWSAIDTMRSRLARVWVPPRG
jgi:serine/threonine-protein kinase HipA